MDGPTVEQRLAALEQSNRRLRAAALGAVAVALVACAAALSRRAPDELVARRLALTDASGAVRARVAPTEHGGFGLTVSDATGRPRAMLGVDSDGSPRFAMAGQEGQALAELA